MSCEHCAHCRTEKERREAESMRYDRGALLLHPKLGKVTYWRAAPELSPNSHVVVSVDDEDRLSYVDAEDLIQV